MYLSLHFIGPAFNVRFSGGSGKWAHRYGFLLWGISWRRGPIGNRKEVASGPPLLGVSGLTDRPSELEGPLAIRKSTIQLGLLHREQDFLKAGTRTNSHSLEVLSGDEPRRAHLLGRGFGQKVRHEFVSVKATMTRKAIQAMQFQVLFKLGEAHEPLERRLPHLADILKAKVTRDARFDLFGVVV